MANDVRLTFEKKDSKTRILFFYYYDDGAVRNIQIQNPDFPIPVVNMSSLSESEFLANMKNCLEQGYTLVK